MSRILSCLLAGVTILLSNAAAARQWTSRSGSDQVEAELVAADDNVVVLKRASDGKLLTVPLAQLSLADVEYVRRTRLCGAPAQPPASTDPTGSAAAGKQDTRSAEPPRAVAGQTGWQVAPDPFPPAWSLPAGQALSVALPPRFANDDVLLSVNRSPFVLLTVEKPEPERQLWDLRKGAPAGRIRADLSGMTKLAVSPDGQLLAVSSVQALGKLDLWSFQTGKRVRQIDLGAPYASIQGLDFAGNERLVGALPAEKGFVIWDVRNGGQMARIEVYPVPLQTGYALSPGGHYLAAGLRDRIQFFDLRNGVVAGTLATPTTADGRPTAVQTMDFSADGQEFAVLGQRGLQQLLCCWSLQDGQVVAEHPLDRKFRIPPVLATAGRTVTIDWLPPARGWLVGGQWLVDRTTGQPVPISADTAAPVLAPLRRVLDEHRMLVVSSTPSARQLAVVPIPWDAIAERQKLAAEPPAPAPAAAPRAEKPPAVATLPATPAPVMGSAGAKPAGALPALQTYVSAEGGYEVLLPGKPETSYDVLDKTPGPGRTTRVGFARVDLGGGEQCVVWHEHVAFDDMIGFRLWRKDAATLLQTAIAVEFARTAGKTLAEKNLTLGGHPGKEVLVHLTGSVTDIHSRQRIYVIGSTAFGVGWIGSREQVVRPAVDRVLASFQLRGPRDDFATAEAFKQTAHTIHYKEDGNIRQLDFAWDAHRTDDDLRPLGKLAGLRSLKICGPAFSADGLRHLRGLTQLESLDLSEVRQTETTGLVHLSGLRNLRALRFASSDSNHVVRKEGGFRALETLTDLRDLTLPRSFADEDAPILGNMKHLERLWLGFSQATPSSLHCLGSLTNLKELHLSGLPIDDAFLVQLSKLTQLEELGLHRTRITDQGLVHLEPLKNLQNLFVDETALTPAGTRRLTAAIPGLKIKGP